MVLVHKIKQQPNYITNAVF